MGKKVIATILSVVMLMSVLPLYAFAVEGSEHQHTELCYAQAGDLLCDKQESEGHSHEEACYCSAGEYICDLVESEGHTHDDSCYLETEEYEVASDSEAQERQLICELEEAEGHAHSEDCYAKGNELICTYTVANDEQKVISSDSQYDYIKELIINDENIEFDPETQTICVIDVTAEQSSYMEPLNIYQADDHISEFEYWFDVFINGNRTENGQEYLIMDKTTDELRICKAETEIWLDDGSDGYALSVKPNTQELLVLIINQGDQVKARSVAEEWYYDDQRWKDENGEYYDQQFITRPKTNEDFIGYHMTADDSVMEMPFSFEWFSAIFNEFEIYFASDEYKHVEMPGLFDSDDGHEPIWGDILFKIELRDKNGNISLLPKTAFNIYGDGNNFMYMSKDGYIHMTTDAETERGYGEMDFYIPYGYDFRFSVVKNALELGALTHIHTNYGSYDEDGFFTVNERYSSVASQINFFPATNEQIRVEKVVSGDVPLGETFDFIAQRTIHHFDMVDWSDDYKFTTSHMRVMSCYPYRVYDAATDTEVVADKIYYTGEDGTFSLKYGEYAVFNVWTLPDDFDEYTDSGWYHSKYLYDQLNGNYPSESEYVFTEISEGEYVTTITHTHENADVEVEGKTVSGVVAGDRITFVNTYSDLSPELGNLTVSKTVTGNQGESDRNFNFTVTLSDTTINGKYGDLEFANGVATFTLKAGESATASMIPAGVGYTITESDNDGYTVTVNGVEGATISGNIVADETTVVVFNNHKESGSGETPSGPDKPTTPSEPDNPTTPSKPDEPTTPSEPDAPTTPDKPDKTYDDVPKTGDTSHTVLWFALMCISVVGVIITSRKLRYKGMYSKK